MARDVSISAASLIPDDDDSFENEKDFAKLKGEEDNSSVPRSQYSEEEAREAFKRWCRLFRFKGYTDKTEEEQRFKNFKDSLDRKVSAEMLELGYNITSFADRSEEEFIKLTSVVPGNYCSISLQILQELEALAASPEYEIFRDPS